MLENTTCELVTNPVDQKSRMRFLYRRDQDMRRKVKCFLMTIFKNSIYPEMCTSMKILPCLNQI